MKFYIVPVGVAQKTLNHIQIRMIDEFKRPKYFHKRKEDLNSEGLSNPKNFKSVGTGQNIEIGVTPTSITKARIGDSSFIYSNPTS